MNMDYNQWLKLCSFFLFLSLIVPLSLAADRITARNSLSGKQTIVSSGGFFELGFFSPSVWVANRETPISDTLNSELKILNGNLVLTNEAKSHVWSTNLTNPISANLLEAVLGDSGNLILRESSPNNSTRVLWQSFDYPGNTWLPDGKISFNKKNGTGQHLTSWKNGDDPAPGLFSLELEPKGKQYIIKWNGTQQYWTSGTWDSKQQIFNLVPEMRLNYIYNFSFVDDSNESYFTYSVYDNKFISQFVMDTSGQIKMWTWLENTQQWNLQQCQVYAYCGKFGTCNQNSLPFCNCLNGFQPQSRSDWGLSDYSGGCVRKAPL
ncbi:hypothetical protein Cgig2_023561 [Carnegiea gigantea]|uniref:Bulb-type lectin domain-containing protein n=1 Tax=Carnegiea gigantea TaxID=171969 RepID=A0A9Q1JZE6_9CARY|nr:hypothetical protein Cgig2_023561 [Carnegiea gigantea]